MQHSAAPDVRRQFARNLVQAHAFVHARGRFQPATVVDYSVGGLRLGGTFGLFKRDPVQIEFISGIRVPGQVTWSLGAHTGIMFPEPLHPTHPAIIELARRAAYSLNRPTPSIASADRPYGKFGSLPPHPITDGAPYERVRGPRNEQQIVYEHFAPWEE